MPTYEYICDECGHKFDKFQTISADPISICPVCGKNSVRRLLTGGSGLIFKGSGFYITDYKNKKSGKTEKPKKETQSKAKPKAS